MPRSCRFPTVDDSSGPFLLIATIGPFNKQLRSNQRKSPPNPGFSRNRCQIMVNDREKYGLRGRESTKRQTNARPARELDLRLLFDYRSKMMDGIPFQLTDSEMAVAKKPAKRREWTKTDV